MEGKDPPNIREATKIYEELLEHPDYIKYISIGPFTEPPVFQIERALDPRLSGLQVLTRLHNFVLLPKSVKYEEKMQDLTYVYGTDCSVVHELKFVESEIYSIKRSTKDKNIEFVEKLIHFIEEHLPSTRHLVIRVVEEILTEDMSAYPPAIARLESYFQSNLAALQAKSPHPNTKDNVFGRFKSVLTKLCACMDSKTSLIPTFKGQLTFNRIILSPSFPFSAALKELIRTAKDIEPTLFIQILFHIISSISSFIEAKNIVESAALVVLTYRTIFDEIGDLWMYPNRTCKDVILELRDMKIADLLLYSNACPKMDVTLTPRLIFRDDPHYSAAVAELEKAPYMSSPLDILGAVSRSLMAIEESAQFYSKNEMVIFPFEVTFSLFIAIVLSCDLPEFMNLANFVEKYTPQIGLCASIEFAKAKLIAASVHLSELCEKKKSGKNYQ